MTNMLVDSSSYVVADHRSHDRINHNHKINHKNNHKTKHKLSNSNSTFKLNFLFHQQKSSPLPSTSPPQSVSLAVSPARSVSSSLALKPQTSIHSSFRSKKRSSSIFTRALRSTVSSLNLADNTHYSSSSASIKDFDPDLTETHPVKFIPSFYVPSPTLLTPESTQSFSPAITVALQTACQKKEFSTTLTHLNTNSNLGSPYLNPPVAEKHSFTSLALAPPSPASSSSHLSSSTLEPRLARSLSTSHLSPPLSNSHRVQTLRRTASVPTFRTPSDHSSMSISISSGPIAAVPMAASKGPSESSSLFQIASTIKDRLEDVPGISYFLELCISGNFPADQVAPSSTQPPALQASLSQSSLSTDSNRDSTDSHSSTLLDRTTSNAALSTSNAFFPLGRRIDPVTHLWQFFRLGSSLCALFNAVQPRAPLNVIVTTDVKTCKRSVYDFVQGCKSELEYTDEELFTISNVFSDNTTDLLKVRFFFIFFCYSSFAHVNPSYRLFALSNCYLTILKQKTFSCRLKRSRNLRRHPLQRTSVTKSLRSCC